MIRRTSSGVDLYSSEISMELMHTDLPEPVVPAISMCGILAMSPMTGLPVMSLPTAKDRRLFALANAGEPIHSRIKTVLTVLFGTSMPTATLSGMGAIRTFAAPSDSAMSSASAVMREILMPRGMVSSKRVTDGPRTMPMICASMLNESSVSSRHAELSRSSVSAPATEACLPCVSRSIGG